MLATLLPLCGAKVFSVSTGCRTRRPVRRSWASARYSTVSKRIVTTCPKNKVTHCHMLPKIPHWNDGQAEDGLLFMLRPRWQLVELRPLIAAHLAPALNGT